jgi:hypothetical protein
MSHHYKTLVQVVTVICLVTLTGCIIDPNQNGSYGSSAGSYKQPHNTGSSQSAATGYDRGCADAKAGSYDRSGNAGQAYEQGWQACKGGGNASNAPASGASDWDRGCADAKAGSYDRSGNASQAYEEGWNSCKSSGNQSGAQQQGGVEDAKSACLFKFGSSGRVQTVSDLKPGFWEIIVTGNSGRKIACTADAQGKVIDWVEM